MNKQYHFIREQAVLDQWYEKNAANLSLLAVDTEFMRTKTYFPKLCLIQLATHNEVICVDPLTINNLSSVIKLFEDESILKIIHSASQDIETILNTYNILPAPIFDTQVALSTLGCTHLMSYHDAVLTYLGQDLEKTETRTKWNKRPLSQKQINYAYEDVDYLIPLYELIYAQIQDQRKNNELTQAFIPLTIKENYLPNPDAAWKKVKKKNTLKGKRLRLLKLLAKYREITAIKRNLPKRWVLEDAVLIYLSDQYAQEKLSFNQDPLWNKIDDLLSSELKTTITSFWEWEHTPSS